VEAGEKAVDPTDTDRETLLAPAFVDATTVTFVIVPVIVEDVRTGSFPLPHVTPRA
jgi:hypothetical protein